MTATHKQPVLDALNADYLHSAFIIDKEGNEIRITRDMIVACCNQLAASGIRMPLPTKNTQL